MVFTYMAYAMGYDLCYVLDLNATIHQKLKIFCLLIDYFILCDMEDMYYSHQNRVQYQRLDQPVDVKNVTYHINNGRATMKIMVVATRKMMVKGCIGGSLKSEKQKQNKYTLNPKVTLHKLFPPLEGLEEEKIVDRKDSNYFTANQCKLMHRFLKQRNDIFGYNYYNHVVDQIDRYIYLGQLISIHRNWEPKVRRRVALGWQAFVRLTNVWSSKLPLCLKRKVYDQCVLPVLTVAFCILILYMFFADEVKRACSACLKCGKGPQDVETGQDDSSNVENTSQEPLVSENISNISETSSDQPEHTASPQSTTILETCATNQHLIPTSPEGVQEDHMQPQFDFRRDRIPSNESSTSGTRVVEDSPEPLPSPASNQSLHSPSSKHFGVEQESRDPSVPHNEPDRGSQDAPIQHVGDHQSQSSPQRDASGEQERQGSPSGYDGNNQDQKNHQTSGLEHDNEDKRCSTSGQVEQSPSGPCSGGAQEVQNLPLQHASSDQEGQSPSERCYQTDEEDVLLAHLEKGSKDQSEYVVTENNSSEGEYQIEGSDNGANSDHEEEIAESIIGESDKNDEINRQGRSFSESFKSFETQSESDGDEVDSFKDSFAEVQSSGDEKSEKSAEESDSSFTGHSQSDGDTDSIPETDGAVPMNPDSDPDDFKKYSLSESTERSPRKPQSMTSTPVQIISQTAESSGHPRGSYAKSPETLYSTSPFESTSESSTSGANTSVPVQGTKKTPDTPKNLNDSSMSMRSSTSDYLANSSESFKTDDNEITDSSESQEETNESARKDEEASDLVASTPCDASSSMLPFLFPYDVDGPWNRRQRNRNADTFSRVDTDQHLLMPPSNSISSQSPRSGSSDDTVVIATPRNCMSDVLAEQGQVPPSAIPSIKIFDEKLKESTSRKDGNRSLFSRLFGIKISSDSSSGYSDRKRRSTSKKDRKSKTAIPVSRSSALGPLSPIPGSPFQHDQQARDYPCGPSSAAETRPLQDDQSSSDSEYYSEQTTVEEVYQSVSGILPDSGDSSHLLADQACGSVSDSGAATHGASHSHCDGEADQGSDSEKKGVDATYHDHIKHTFMVTIGESDHINHGRHIGPTTKCMVGTSKQVLMTIIFMVVRVDTGLLVPPSNSIYSLSPRYGSSDDTVVIATPRNGMSDVLSEQGLAIPASASRKVLDEKLEDITAKKDANKSLFSRLFGIKSPSDLSTGGSERKGDSISEEDSNSKTSTPDDQQVSDYPCDPSSAAETLPLQDDQPSSDSVSYSDQTTLKEVDRPVSGTLSDSGDSSHLLADQACGGVSDSGETAHDASHSHRDDEADQGSDSEEKVSRTLSEPAPRFKTPTLKSLSQEVLADV
ncbi:hypothetical protein GQR58_022616 [Nymphon striatum]|nr:hypothetical protein GQR58_022616 [Nymphon striatum]